MSIQRFERRGGKVSARLVIWPIVLLVAAASAFFIWPILRPAPRPKIAFITADSTPFWDQVVAGAEQAADQADVDLHVFRPDGTLADQDRALGQAMDLSPDGVAVSPVDADRQTVTLSTIARATVLVTVDSDSPRSDRVCFIGADNYDAGRMCGELVRTALPDGGRVLIASGPLNKANGRDRWRGLVDELLGREYQPNGAMVATDEELSSESFTIAPTMVDPIDPALATSQITEALEGGASFDCIVGLYGYHAIAIANAVEAAGAEDDTKVIGFDAIPETTAAISAGRVFGVIAQDQQGYGYNSVSMLANIKRNGEEASVPIRRVVHFPPIVVTAETLAEAG